MREREGKSVCEREPKSVRKRESALVGEKHQEIKTETETVRVLALIQLQQNDGDMRYVPIHTSI